MSEPTRTGTWEGPSQLDRIEAKLDALLRALAEDEDPSPEDLITLDGAKVGGERDQTKGLG